MKIIVGFTKDLQHWEKDILSDDIQGLLSKHHGVMVRALISPHGMVLHVELEAGQEQIMQYILQQEFPELDITFVND